MKTKCQIAHFVVTIEEPDAMGLTTNDGAMAKFSVPAYTREPDNLRERVTEYLGNYLEGSADLGQSVSVADFAMFLLATAANEPREQGAMSDADNDINYGGSYRGYV